MNFRVNINFNVDTRHSVRNGNRRAIMNHERREHGFTANRSIDPSLSKYNDYNNLLDYKNIMKKTLMPYVEHHNNLKSVRKNPKRKIRSVKQLLDSRGKRIPYKYVVLKMGNGSTQRHLLQLFKVRGLKYSDYANAINKAFLKYARYDNSHYQHIKFDHEDSNLDEVKRRGGVHCHLGALGIATTKGGKISLSFDRATKQQYKGKTNISSWHIMQQKEANNFLSIATPIFQQYLGKDFNFQLQRNPASGEGLSHDEYIEVKEADDRLRADNQQLRQLLSSANKQNIQLKAEIKKSNESIISVGSRWRKRYRNLQKAPKPNQDNDYQALLTKFRNLSKEYSNLAKQLQGGLLNGERSFVNTLINKSLKSTNK